MPFESKIISIRASCAELHLEYQSREWRSPLSTDAKAWFWGTCSSNSFQSLVSALKLTPTGELVARWPGAADGPPKTDGWHLKSIDSAKAYFYEESELMTFAAFVDGHFYVKVTTN